MSDWSVLLKVRSMGGDLSRDAVERLVDLLPGGDKGFTGGDGADFTVSFWVEARDASEAVLAGWHLLDRGRARLGLGEMTAVRTHAASAAQRLTGFLGVEQRVSDATAWSVLLKCVADPARPSVSPPDLQALSGRLGPDAAVAGGASSLVARFWVSAPDAREADELAREAFMAALAGEGLEGWTLVRAHHAVARERAEELYRGAAERVEREARA